MIENTISEVFAKGTEEYDTIVGTYDLIVSNAPTISVESKNIMALADTYKVKLASIYYGLSQKISAMKREYQKTYDNHYVRLVKLGRPSHTAIDTEIRTIYPDYVLLSQQIEDFEQVKELISIYIKAVDSVKQTATEMLRDSRRID